MFFKRFRVQVALRLILLTTSIYLLTEILYTRHYKMVPVIVSFLIYQVYLFIRFVERTNQQLSRFFLAVKQGDFASSFSAKEIGPSFSELIQHINDMMDQIKEFRSEKEEQYRYLQTIVHHLGIGLIVFKSDGTVDLINTTARRLLNVGHLRNINALSNFCPSLLDTMQTLHHGGKALVKIENVEMELAVHAAEFILKDNKFTLISLQDIRSELQEKEQEAWQTLIRVLTHEIMNSMTPITSMSATVIDLLAPFYHPNGPTTSTQIDAETITDIANALTTIHKRSIGLAHFVSAYRNLTLIPQPIFRIFSIEELFARVEKLMESTFMEKGIRLIWWVDPKTLELTADANLIEQVLLNLLLNGVEALQECNAVHPELHLTAQMDRTGSPIIQVTDNGPGIVPEALKKVFIPFFTTKKSGSGIGLSLSRQIMKLHGGSIHVESQPDIKTVFTLKF